jgi:SOS-response transcriptional repressor LexA
MVLSRKMIGEKVRQARLKKSIKTGEKYTQDMMSKDLNISRSYLGDIERGTKYPNYVLLSKISELCDVPLNYFDENIESQLTEAVNEETREYNTLPGQTNIFANDKNYALSVVGEREYGYLAKKFIEVPVFEVIDYSTSIWSDENVSFYESIPIDRANGFKYFGLIAPDNSMDSSRICEGDIVLAREQIEYNDNDIVIAVIGNGSAIIRKYNRSGENIILLPLTTRKEYGIEILEPSKVKILGKVVKFIGRV